MIRFRSRRRHIDFKSVWKNDARGPKTCMCRNLACLFLCQFLRKTDSVSLNHHVHIHIFLMKKQISHHSANEIGFVPEPLRDLPRFFEHIEHSAGQTLLQHQAEIFRTLAFLQRQSFLNHFVLETQQIGACDDSFYMRRVFAHQHKPGTAGHHLPVNLVDRCTRVYERQIRYHIVANRTIGQSVKD